MERQTEFVINILNKNYNTSYYSGYYVELGSRHYLEGNNTYVLEKEYNWKGVGFDIIPEFVEEYNKKRNNPCMLHNALTFDYLKYFKENNFPKQIDFLQVDVDSGYDEKGNPIGNAAETLLGLISLPLSEYRFSIITFEHDANMHHPNIQVREAQRVILSALGYKLVFRDHFEDWWVDPNIIPISVFREFMHAPVL
jgi:hypothetical protein